MLKVFPVSCPPDRLTSTGIPQYIHGQWVITEEDSQYEDTDGQFPTLWPESTPEVVELVTAEDLSWQTPLEPYPMTEQGDCSAFIILSHIVSLKKKYLNHSLQTTFTFSSIRYSSWKRIVGVENHPDSGRLAGICSGMSEPGLLHVYLERWQDSLSASEVGLCVRKIKVNFVNPFSSNHFMFFKCP